jgi:hypothetical protein
MLTVRASSCYDQEQKTTAINGSGTRYPSVPQHLKLISRQQHNLVRILTVKGKAIPVTGRGDP